MSGLTDRRTISFVVRLWQEPVAEDAAPVWRGQIEEVESGEISHFQLSPALVGFLSRLMTDRSSHRVPSEPVPEGKSQ